MLNLDIRDASRELNILRALDRYSPPFRVIGTYRLVDDGERPEATVMLQAGDQEMHEADVGVGPVDALAKVLKKSLGRLFPELKRVKLLDFESHVIQGTTGTSARVEVTVVFTDGKLAWKVSSSSDNINLASFHALLDGYEYAIFLKGKGESNVQSPKSKKSGLKAKAVVKAKTKSKARVR